ncbi:MAG: CARDB domain-containing protein, partial [Thermoplasmata archaeon]
MVQRNSIIGSEKDLRKTSSVVLVTAMVLAGFFTLFAFAPANVVAAPELTAWGEDMAPPEGVFPGDNNISMMHLLLIAPQDAVGVYSLTFDLTASSTVAASGDIEKIFLFWDYDNNSKVDQFELNSLSNMGVLATVNNPTFPQTITLSSFTVAAADEEDIIVFIDTATGTSGKKVGLKLTAVSSDDPSPDIVNGASSDTSIKFIIWSDEMEGGVGGWTVTGTPKVLWHQTNYWYYVGESPSTSWWYADEAIRVYATGSQRNYGDLISESIDLSGYTDPAMSFWHDLVNENSAGYDEGALFIEDTAAPGVWNEIGRWYQSPTNWSKVVFNLSAYAGKTIRLKFNFDTVDGSNNWFRGWNIDRLYLFGGQEAHDIATMSFGTEPEKFALPGSTVYVNASIANLGQSDEDNGTAGIDVYLRIDGSFVDSAYIASIPQGGSVPVSFQWIPSAEGDYEVCIYAWPVSGETITGNNLACTTIQVRSVPAKKIVVVRSYGTKMGPAITTWVDLNANWESYGPTPIDIDWQSLNKTGITYADIVASGADTLVVSASAGLGAPQAWSELSDTEITAIRQYTLEGHGLVATYSTFYYLIPNNNKLTEMFGIQNQDYNRSISDANTNMHKLDAAHPLFNNVPTDPFTIGNPMSIWPKDDNAWNASDLRAGSLGGQYIAMSDNNETTLVVFKKLVFISWMPEWFGNTVDKQILYNAIVWSQYEVVPHDVSMSNIKGPSRVKPSPTVDITATLSNLASVVEDNGTAGIDVLLTQDGVIVDRTNIPSLGVGESQDVTLTWDPPDAPVPNTYNICMRAVQVVGETDTTNNEVCMSIGVIS